MDSLRLAAAVVAVALSLIAVPAASAAITPFGALEPVDGADCLGAQCESLNPRFDSGVSEMAFSPDGRHAYAINGGDVVGLARDVRTGALAELTEPGWCWSANGGGGCSDAAGMSSPRAVVVSPDGKHVYVTSTSDPYPYSWLAMFERNAHDGTLRQIGCLAAPGSNFNDECTQSWLMFFAQYDIEMSPDGKNLYVPSEHGPDFAKEFSILSRNPDTGLLDETGCVASRAYNGRTDPDTLHPICAIFPALDGTRPAHVEVSEDGKQIYLSTWNTVIVGKRSAETGLVSGIADPWGCVNRTGTYPLPEGRSGTCTTLRGFGTGGSNPDVETSPDGKSVYIKGQYGIAITRRDPVTGALKQAAGEAGCVAVNMADGCALAKGYFSFYGDLEVSPDGRSVYSTFRDSGTESHGINVFQRDTVTGALAIPAGKKGCAMDEADEADDHGCEHRKAVSHWLLAIPPDSRNVYTNGVTGSYHNGSYPVDVRGIGQFARAQSAVEVRGSKLVHTDLTGYAQGVDVKPGDGLFRIADTAGTIQPGHGCRRVTANVAECSSAGVTGFDSKLGSGDDRLTVTASLAGTITGESGADRITPGARADVVDGGEGDDTLYSSLGRDEMRGGPGRDLATYQLRSNAVKVSLDGQANDGTGTEGDLVDGVERVWGGSAADTLVGGDAAEELKGLGGADSLDGGAGGDTLHGGPGNDTATYASRTAPVTVTLNAFRNDGETGEGDFVNGADVENVIGGDGGDKLTGSKLANVLTGGFGADQLLARDGTTAVDTLSCGDGADAFQVDPSDVFATGAACETAMR